MRRIEVWALHAMGQDQDTLVARFETKDEAEKAKPAAGGYGGIVKPEELKIYTTAYEWRPMLNAEAAERGLAKLTSEERAALGLPIETPQEKAGR